MILELTKEEIQEVEVLRIYQKNSNRFMSIEEYNRLQYLQRKKIHNCCPNPHCIGYEGTEEEIICPKCNEILSKTI